ncbi:aspartyl/glutamyl-tRNA amidotransferase subunit A [Legionella quinlivanii]|uniref:Glutamyl-tRNA(Gln) amidotransferase subunit A n=1 Tax=Legionella quinlivanii TaxID=45073 RepID=A0A0W0Y3U2_9GAMM|nr:Asp-tRNA(Asn)/Glu-tRNA(Gln) amidotransferase subunit GatA [Legionella quinlivanii]KTD51693.1 aspartyl/glutamyl-tRNA amidotransferase subunit A [Legionella quinlivanii]MCW8451030.1 Asp-tRNA(Asn)/Glu-tRNA(Gln) amidotransferase subunit GatA [Legionella quinlivanii]SEF63250.1 aspartyl/glutamyl-tRNA(Asn/Gln) amidotransferase subunit A [Legionella quinlivanii DSM 21216]STY10780.1 aspartyl/glutamyl-tRNA amidotransferase subunit A [Legionella quinlivanii]
MFKNLRELITALHSKKISSTELTRHYLKRIDQYKTLNCFIHVDAEAAMMQAQKADQLLHKGEAQLLTGVPMAHKDIFCTSGLATTCGSRMLANYKSPFSATVVNKFAAHNAVLLGKTNMDEFAMGSTNESSYFGPVKNPWNLSCVPGGSSGGSAAAVAADLSAFATGSDTGGSIRQPAAFCGISGIKPTYGLVSRYGMVAYASSLDQGGPMARTAEDLALVLGVMAGFDPNDSTSYPSNIPDYSSVLNQSLKGLRVGLPSCFFQEEVNAEIQLVIREAVKQLEEAGAVIVEMDLALQSLWVPCYYLIACAEASSNLSRYDGIRFGYRSAKAGDIRELISASRSEGFGLEVKRRILTGTYALSSGYFDAYYLKALKIRRLIQQELLTQFSKVDIILGPTTPTPAFQLGEVQSDPVQNYLADIFTVASNLAGIPAISIPAGQIKGLPVGMQLMAKHFNEALLLNVAHQFQLLTDWHQRRPAL